MKSAIDAFEVDKVHAARRQLDVAIRLHFAGDNPVAVLTLAVAAATIFSDVVEHRFPENSWDARALQATSLSAREYFGTLRKGQNFLRHTDADPDDTLRWSAKDTEALIMAACMNAGLLDSLSPSAYVFKRWYIAKNRSRFPTDWEPAVAAMEYFPNLDRMSAEDQYAVGARRVYEADEQTVD